MLHEDPRRSDPLGSAGFSYERWREGFLKLVLRGSSIIGLIVAVFSVIDSWKNEQFLLIGIYASAWVFLAAITLVRGPYWLRVGTFLLLLYALGVSGLLENGMRGDARLFFLSMSVMAALLVTPRAGMAVLGFSLLTIGAIAPFAISGRIHLLSKVTVAGDANLWIMSSLDFLAINAAILIGVTLFIREFQNAQDRTAKVVTDLDRERSSLKESEERYRRIFHRSPVSLWEEDISALRRELRALKETGVDDLAGYLDKNPAFVAHLVASISVVDVNDSTLGLYGAARREQLLGPLDQTLEPAALLDFREQILAIAEGRKVYERESTAVSLANEKLQILTSCSIPDESDQHQHMLVNVFDIGKRKNAEAERRAMEEELNRARRMESIGRLAAGAAHDLNNLLGPILGFAEILMEKTPPGHESRGDLEQIIGAGIRARDLTQQLLAFGRKQDLTLRPCDLREILSGFMKILRASLRDHIRVHLDVPEQVCMVMADPGQIEQVLMNLAVNAQDAMGSGGVLTITLADDPGDQRVLLAVRDTGHGMEAATRERIFEPFFTTKPSGRGTGLGLATVYGIVAQHGGDIRVDSRPGEGSLFTIRLPRIEEPPARSLDRPKPSVA